MPDTQTPEKPQVVNTVPAAEAAAQYVPTELHTQTEGVNAAGNEEDETAEAAKENGIAPAGPQALKTETPSQTTIPEIKLDGNLSPNMTNFMEYKKAKLNRETAFKNFNKEDLWEEDKRHAAR